MSSHIDKYHPEVLFLLMISLLMGCSTLVPPKTATSSTPDSLIGTWETMEINCTGQIDFMEVSKLRLVILDPMEMYLFAIYPDGMVYRCFDTQPVRIEMNEMYFGPLGSCLRFKWSLAGGRLVWTKEKEQEFRCTFKRIGEADPAVAKLFWKCPDSYHRFSKYFRAGNRPK